MRSIGATTGVVAGMVATVDDTRDRHVSGLSGRIAEAVALTKKSENAVSIAIGFERTQLNMTRSRLDKNPSTGVDVRVVANLAKVAGVSLDWLVFGEGSAVAAPDARARRAAEILGYAADVIEEGLSKRAATDDHRTLFWRIQRAEEVRPANRTAPSPPPPAVKIAARDPDADEGDNHKPAKRAAAKAKGSGAK